MKLKTIILLLFCYFNLIQSQESVIRFQHLTPENGLSQGHVLCMLQDQEGYIWVGTYYGLNRYDGYSFKLFSKNKNNPLSVVSDVIYSLFEDHKGYIWVGTVNGLDVFDKKTETFDHIPVHTPDGLSDGYIRCITQDGEGNIWVGTNSGGLNKIEYNTRKITHFKSNKYSAASKISTVNDLFADISGNIWIASDNGLSVFNITSGTLENLKLPFEKTTAFHADKSGKIWIGNATGKLASLDIQKRTFINHDYLPADLKSRSLRIRDIAQDIHGNILIATIGAGLVIYNPLKNKSGIYTNNIYDNSTISSNEAYSLLVDRSYTVFVGTYGRGISKYSPFNLKFPVYFVENKEGTNGDINSYTSCVQDYKGRLIIGSYSGFFVYDKDWKYQHFLPGKTYAENKILIITIAPDSTIWMGTNRGIHQYDKNLNKIGTYNLINDNLDHQIYCMHFDHLNNLWLGMFVTEGLIKIPEHIWRNKKLKTLDFKVYRTSDDSASLFGDQVWSIRQDKLRNLWIGTNIGICRYNYNSDNFTRYNITELCKTIEFDNYNTMWIATRGEGIFSYNPETGIKKHYTTSHGLSQNFVFGVIADNHNKLWFSSENGLSKFDPSTEQFRNYDFFDGLPNNRFDDRSEKLLPDGRIYMGTAHGFTIFNPEKIKDDTSKSRVILSNLVISNKPINYYREKDNSLVPPGSIKHITLTPDQKDISFGFAALHYSAPKKIKYKYKLENFDKEWIYTDASNRVARYTNLDGGKYTFYAMATNGDGIWNDEPLMITVTVQPPLVKTLGFNILVVVFMIFLILMITRWQKERVINQNITLARLVDERTQEISEKNKLLENNAFVLNQANALLEKNHRDIEAQKEELSEQRDKLMKLNATKDKLFSVIAHDLKNPFNVIIGFSELMLNNYHLYTDEKRMRITKQVNQASRVAYQLLENLLEWSRAQKGSITFNPIAIPVGEILSTALLQVKDFARNKGIRIQVDHSNLENMVIKADVNMLNTIFRNLLNNAVKFSHKKSIIHIRVLLLEQNLVRFSIIDHGVGMSQEICNQLFQMDTNIHMPGTEGEKGTGLGLLICKEFIEAHNGHIWVESEPGEGTTFHFAIPVS